MTSPPSPLHDPEAQAAFVKAITCPECGRLSHHMRVQPLGRTTQGLVTTELCVCVHGHTWPLIAVVADRPHAA